MEFFTMANGIPLRACDSGKGKVIVMLHGYLETMEVWGNFAENLSQKFRIITLDIPGHGLSGFNGNKATMEFIADCVKSLLDKQSILECMILGHSMGGYAALVFAQKYPETAKSICLLSSTPNADNIDKKRNRNREIELIKADKLELILRTNISRGFADFNVEKFDEEIFAIQNTATVMDKNGIIACLEAMRDRKDMNDFVETIQEKMLFVFGKSDNYIPFEEAQKLIKKYPKATTIILENSGHTGFIEEPQKLIEELTKFAEKTL